MLGVVDKVSRGSLFALRSTRLPIVISASSEKSAPISTPASTGTPQV